MDAGNVSSMSSIGLGKTMTEAFADLRVEQGTISTRAKELIKMYEELKGREDEDDLEVTTEMQEYCEGRQALFDSIRDWYKRSGEHVADHQDNRTEDRIRRIHVFFNKIREKLRETRPLGLDEKECETDRIWLNAKVEGFPESVVPAERFLVQKQEGWKARLRSGASSALEAMGVSPRRRDGPQRTSTPESMREGENKKKEKRRGSAKEGEDEGKEEERKE